ncbi:pyridoxal phosphate-dependent aminotransferase [Mageeibacillus indolicus]|jgi:hypothetical protein|uniref:Aminotransferase n=1 Tax=Mageeibacillus indolicus TaxID=884684 RepID=A0A2J8B1U5_9FIRM|nr:aminotransferase class I/II-fold pyridoxal phosphate-dependent enzyme [Mageeibacillus indolicus]KFA56941.1 hypothetical protein HMPREF1632_06315 [Mageeibacillus indolicus 0009-5]PNH18705.1 hypothetical protein B7R76_03870 [Mageeibacillus indolicus]
MPKETNLSLNNVKESPIRVITRLATQTPGCQILTIGEPDFITPPAIQAAAIAGLQAGNTHYPPFNGRRDLLENLSEFVAENYGFDYSPEEIIVTNGATEGIFATLLALLNPGDEVIIPLPAFGLYAAATNILRGQAVPLLTTGLAGETEADNTARPFQITEAALAATITSRTKAIIITSPNNPTGSIYDRRSIAAVATAAAREGFYIICDEVYRDLIYETAEFISNNKSLRQQLIVIQSFSKPWAMTGWRLGYLMADRSLQPKIALAHQNMITSAANFTQDGGIAALKTPTTAMREAYRQRRDYIIRELRSMGFKLPVPAGAFYAYPNLADISSAFAGKGSEDFCRTLIQRHLLAVVPGTAFGTDGFVRISFCYGQEALKVGMARLHACIDSLRK